MIIDFVAHESISSSVLRKICRLKKQHWDYSIKDQIVWINSNLRNEDFHLILKDLGNDNILGYMNLINLNVTINDKIQKMIGIGNVCVDKNYQLNGYGFLLMKVAEYYLRKENTNGILLCREKLLPFYDTIRWSRYCGTAKIDKKVFNDFIYFYNEVLSSEISVDRKF